MTESRQRPASSRHRSHASSLQNRRACVGEPHACAIPVDSSEVLNRFEDLIFPMEVEFGSLDISIRDILELKTGAVLRTLQSARAPLTLRAGETPIAVVETQVSGQAMSVRVLNILDPAGRRDDTTAAARQAQ